MLSMDVFQINHVHNSLNRLLDLVFINNMFFEVMEIPFPMLNNSVHHVAICCILKFESCIANSLFVSNEINLNFCKGDFITLDNYFQTIDWLHVLSGLSLQSAYKKFIDVIQIGFHENIPKRQKCKLFKVPWSNKRLVNLKNVKNKAFKNFRKSNSEVDRKYFFQIRKEYDFLNKYLHKQYVLNIQSRICNEPKAFWTFLNNKKKCSTLQQNMEYNGESSNDLQGSCEVFAKFFETTYVDHSSSNTNQFTCHLEGNLNLSNLYLSEYDILDGLSKLKSSLTPGPDGIPSFVLKKCQYSLAFPLQIIFNLSLSTGVFLDEWKFSYINPVYKAVPTFCNLVENFSHRKIVKQKFLTFLYLEK
ncbi:uncharacterized protein LOC129907237 [Episyrphus balteatus]|uniref:uncharacterized protein LOC129907237 n=1 Tax=Episyrphus balteatus TaxID=286459 RepID=UPI0024854EDD|nr:uncharacterized protein LOC129907237 [Episyrphus balteatus]